MKESKDLVEVVVKDVSVKAVLKVLLVSLAIQGLFVIASGAGLALLGLLVKGR